MGIVADFQRALRGLGFDEASDQLVVQDRYGSPILVRSSARASVNDFGVIAII
jgi:hypothetical protein